MIDNASNSGRGEKSDGTFGTGFSSGHTSCRLEQACRAGIRNQKKRAMTIKARKARSIRRGCQRRSQHRDGLGVSELFLAPPIDAHVIVSAKDVRLKLYLLGFSRIPEGATRKRGTAPVTGYSAKAEMDESVDSHGN